MALYIPASRRRRRVVVVGLAALVAGIALGLLLSRLTTPSVDDQVRSKQRDAEQLVARLDGLSLEYEQSGAAGASGADAREGAIEGARSISSDTQSLTADLPWLADAQRQVVVQAVAAVGDAVEAGASVDEVKRAVAAAGAARRTAAGIQSS